MFAFAKLVFLSSCVLAAVASAAPNLHRQNDLPPPFNGTHTSDGALLNHSFDYWLYDSICTFFKPDLGACGFTNGPNYLIVTVSTELFDSFP